jgi:DNA replication and repair protein RecF
MHIRSLKIENLRVLERLNLVPGTGLNFVVGDNGAGKTSLLEAIYLAGRGRTFRHADAGPMIRHGADSVVVVVEIMDGLSGRQSILGVRREKKGLTCRLDGQDVKRRSVLAEALPIQWIGSQPQLLLGLGPDIRRRFLDMGMFHVEHDYLQVFTNYQRNLRQRNAAIKQGDRQAVRIWDPQLGLAGELLNQSRTDFVDRLLERLSEIIASWKPGFSISYRYRPGWDDQRPLAQQLQKKIDTDLKLGYTTVGPHRAELCIIAGSGLAEKQLSRGQQKILVLALNLALLDLIADRLGRVPILLIDDLAAELDRNNRKRMIEELKQRGGQVFITKIDESAITTIEDAKTFHVEHGVLCD